MSCYSCQKCYAIASLTDGVNSRYTRRSSKVKNIWYDENNKMINDSVEVKYLESNALPENEVNCCSQQTTSNKIKYEGNISYALGGSIEVPVGPLILTFESKSTTESRLFIRTVQGEVSPSIRRVCFYEGGLEQVHHDKLLNPITFNEEDKSFDDPIYARSNERWEMWIGIEYDFYIVQAFISEGGVYARITVEKN